MSDAPTLKRIKDLRAAASGLRGATQRWAEKYADRKYYDKQGFGFTMRTDWAGAFKMPPMAFEAYVGTYGSSSVGTAWSVDKAVIDRFMAAALNVHKQAIFDTIAELAEREAAELVTKAREELAALQLMLADAESPLTDASCEAEAA